jgi:F420H(2)-dependent quinone reductase
VRAGGGVLGRLFGLVNPRLVTLIRSPRGGRALGRQLTVLTYTGRRSGRRISTPVGYRRSGDVVTIPVGMADRKNWWRNFTGTGGSVSVLLDGVERGGHAVADRDARGRVTVRVQLSAAP